MRTFLVPSVALSLLSLFSAPAQAQALSVPLYNGEYVEYRVSLPAGTYTFSIESASGNPNIGVFQIPYTGSFLATGTTVGNDAVTLDLPENEYMIRLEMYNCFNFFGGTCTASLALARAGDQDFQTPVYYSSSSGAGGAAGSDDGYCESHEFRNAAGICVPNPVFR